MQTSKKKIPLIENILLLGLKSEELNKIQSLEIGDLENFQFKPVLLENYQSNYIQTVPDEEFLSKICEFSFPYGVVNYSDNGIFSNKKQLLTFCLNSKNNILKHISCAYIQSGLKISDENIILINTGIVLISSLDIYECHKEILSHLIEMITNNYTKNKKKRTVFLIDNNDKTNIAIEEFKLLSFYFSFLLDSLIINESNQRSLCLSNISNNYNQNIFFKVYFNNNFLDNKDNNTIQTDYNLIDNNNSLVLTLKEYDTSIILEEFYMDDLIKLYYALLLDKQIILLFQNFYDINILIHSLLSITYPLNNGKKYEINFINKSDKEKQITIIKEQQNSITALFYTDDGIENSRTSSFVSTTNNSNIPLINNNFPKNAFVYNLVEKKFINCPINNNSFLPLYIVNDIKSQLYFALAEKLAINSEMSFEETDLGLIFEISTCQKINSILYLNLKIKCIFFRAFLLLMGNLNKSLDFNYNNAKKSKSTENINIYFLNTKSFISGNDFNKKLISSKNFQKFVKKYVKKFKIKQKYKFIYNTLNDLNNLQNPNEKNNYLDTIFREQIRNSIINYYNFDYINLDSYFSDYFASIEDKKFYTSKPEKNFSLFQLLHIDNLDKNNKNFCKNNSFINYLDSSPNFLNKFELHKILNSVKKIPPKKEISKLFPFKPFTTIKMFNQAYGAINKNDSKDYGHLIRKNDEMLQDIDSLLGNILNSNEFSYLKQEFPVGSTKRELSTELKSIPTKKNEIMKNKKLSPSARRNSYLNNINNQYSKSNNNFKHSKKLYPNNTNNSNFSKVNSQMSKGKKNSIKNRINRPSKNCFNDNEQNYNLNVQYEKNYKKINNNFQVDSQRSHKKNKESIQGPIGSSKKYEDNMGHLPKLVGDVDDDLMSDDDENN